MMTIWKYMLEPDIEITMPINSEILKIDTQRNKPVMWVLVNPNEKKMWKRRFISYGTGHTIPKDPGAYIGSFQMDDGRLVFHVFNGKLKGG